MLSALINTFSPNVYGFDIKAARTKYPVLQKDAHYIEWVAANICGIVDGYYLSAGLSASYLRKGVDEDFGTKKAELFIKKWLVSYAVKLFELLYDARAGHIELYDNSLNRYLVEKVHSEFGNVPEILFLKNDGLTKRIWKVLIFAPVVLRLALDGGIRLFNARKSFKVMRESVWGLFDIYGDFFHDDYFVDGDRIKKEDVLFYSRGYSNAPERDKAFADIKRSKYASFSLNRLSISASSLIFRIIPFYVIRPLWRAILNINNRDYGLVFSMYLHFTSAAMRYEKVFSVYSIGCEIGHNYFEPSHVAEAIVCNYHGAKYCFVQLSDNSVKENTSILPYLGCDKYFVWGKAHIKGVEGPADMFTRSGFVFKRFISEVRAKRTEYIAKMLGSGRGKIISFIDEPFGGSCKMTAQNYVAFWALALKTAERYKEHSIIVKPKDMSMFKALPKDLIEEFGRIKEAIESINRTSIIDSKKWSFIEVIGISDAVVTQGMTSSATIAIISGLEGFYINFAGYHHPFYEKYKGLLAFKDDAAFFAVLDRFLKDGDSPRSGIPEEMIRDYDEYPDGRALDIVREYLSEKNQL